VYQPSTPPLAPSESGTPKMATPVPGYPRTSPTPPSPPSTTFSQFDITATEPDLPEDACRKLSVIQEGSIEATPSISVGRSRTENVWTPALETDYGYSPTTNFTVRSPSGEEEPVALMDVIKTTESDHARAIEPFQRSHSTQPAKGFKCLDQHRNRS